jgi:hypothetical protein
MESDIKELKEKIYWRIKDRKADYKSADDLESIYKELEEIISRHCVVMKCCGNPVMDNGFICCGEYELE